MEIVFADDHDLIRESLRPFLNKLADDVNVREAANLAEALEAAAQAESLDLILLDLNMPDMNGFTGIGKMAAAFPDTPIVILSGYINRDNVVKALNFGASGYIPKTASGDTLIRALQLVLSGVKYLPSELLSDVDSAASLMDSGGGISCNNPDLQKLAERQRTILKLVVEGKTYKEIAKELGLAEITIKVEVRKIFRKIGATNRSQAIGIAVRSGMYETYPAK